MSTELVAIDMIRFLSKAIWNKLGRRHSVDIKYLLDARIEEEFMRCLRVAMVAFLDKLLEKADLTGEADVEKFRNVLSRYFRSTSVTEELSKLLDPGFEVFDEHKVVVGATRSIKRADFPEFDESSALEAWKQFRKAFSFASRSAPKLREFLRAGYEAATYSMLTDIRGALQKFDYQISLLEYEERKIAKSIKEYDAELHEYQDWSIAFQLSLS